MGDGKVQVDIEFLRDVRLQLLNSVERIDQILADCGDVRLVRFQPERKIHVLKAVRTLTRMSLGDAKRIIESAPCLLGISPSRDAIGKLEEAGAVVEIC